MRRSVPHLLVLDVDNTLFDWLPYYAESNTALLATLAEMIDVPYPLLIEEFKQLMEHYDSTNSFILKELPSLASKETSVDHKTIYQRCSEAFLQKATAALTPYPGTTVTLDTTKRYRPHVKIVALTDSPASEAVWKIERLGLADYFDGVYGLDTPPLVPSPAVLEEIITACKKYRGAIKQMPSEYEKPSTKGLEMVMSDFGLNASEKDRVIYVGDNLKKDIALGKKSGVLTCWSEFGVPADNYNISKTLALSPAIKIKQNVPNRDDLRVRPDVTLRKFSDILNHLF